MPTDIGLPWMHLKDFDFPQPQAFCQNHKSTKYSLYRPATTAMTATRTPARIQAKTAPAHPGWPETSKSDASTCKWVGDDGGAEDVGNDDGDDGGVVGGGRDVDRVIGDSVDNDNYQV